MHMHNLQRLLWTVVLLACSGAAWAEQVTATFDFSSPQSLAAMGLATPTSSVRTNITSPITKQGVTMTPSTSPVPQVTYYKEAYNLYMFSNTSITLSVPDNGVITGVTFTGLYETVNMKASTGTISGLEWSGSTGSLKLTATGSNTIYSVTVTYTAGIPIETVTGLGEFRKVPDGTVARLYLPDDYNCRVTYASEDGAEVYLRDKTGAIMLDNVDTSRTFKHGQHIAGWITGKSYYKDGMFKLVADGAFTNTSQLVIADAVTEKVITPTTISAAALLKHAANWIKVENMKMQNGKAVADDNEITINNLYNLGVTDMFVTPYNEATFDFVGLSVPTANGLTLIPTYENGNQPVTYVVKEDVPFVAPQTNIPNTAVRLDRKLTGNQWNTYVLPFNMSHYSGTVMEPKQLANGTLTFSKVSGQIAANKPYLFKPSADNNDAVVFKGVTLYAGGATTVNGMTGMYNPTFVNSTVTALAYMGDTPVLVKVEATELPTTHAYFTGVNMLNVNGLYISLYGDINADGDVDIADVNSIINVILKTNGTEAIDGDVNGDGAVDIADVNKIINIILGLDSTPDVVLHSPSVNINAK